jgi:glycerol-3-phosphate acyltransferase PlsX
MRIALDAMGGDQAPKEIIAGAVASLDLIDKEDQLILIGDEELIKKYLTEMNASQDKLVVVHAPEVIGMDEQPVDALRKKRKSSISIMAKMAADKETDVSISAGNTGACVAACQMRMRTLPGVLRPGILVVFPTFAGPVTVCDVGANIAPKPSHLHQYALMASIYAKEVIGIKNPTVGLISIGQEDAKGNELVKKVNQLLREDPRIDFVGNVESREFLNRPADVVVCDGFVGNVILKLTEGLAEGLFKAILREIASLKPEMVSHFQPVIDSLYAKHDYNEYGGAPLLGVDGTCIICHGSSDARAIKNAIVCSRKQAKMGVNAKIAKVLEDAPVTEDEDNAV